MLSGLSQCARPREATRPQTAQLQGPWHPPCPLNQGDWVSLVSKRVPLIRQP